MQDVDLFVMDYFPAGKQLGTKWLNRGQIHNVAKNWLDATKDACLADGLRLNIRTIENDEYETGLDFTVRARKEAFDTATTEVFILTDNDMLPYNSGHVKSGVNVLSERKDFAILSAWPSPHTIIPLKELPGRIPYNNDLVMEHYSCGGFRFCRKQDFPIEMPEIRVEGYDGHFCRSLWENYQLRVGYLKQAKAFHLGTHCTSLWGET